MSLTSLCDKLVTIERMSETGDAWGGITESYASVGTAKARIYPVSGSDAVIHGRPDMRITHRFYFPGTPDIKADDRLLYNLRYFYVQVVRNIDEQGKFLTVDCEERDG
jgi:SPP1 family predicted phage head-tail adaptor